MLRRFSPLKHGNINDDKDLSMERIKEERQAKGHRMILKSLRRNSSLSMNRASQQEMPAINGQSNKGSEADSTEEYIATPSNTRNA